MRMSGEMGLKMINDVHGNITVKPFISSDRRMLRRKQSKQKEERRVSHVRGVFSCCLSMQSAPASLTWFDSALSQGLASEVVINLQHKSRGTAADQRLPGAG